jgi:predicted AAA+ superfamily ATPase
MERHYLLLDEIQEVEGWEKAINAFMVDFNMDLYLTGSNAHLLSSELATYISGRYIEIPVRPLVFSEHMAFRRELAKQAHLDEQEEFARYLRFGGLPGIHWMNGDAEVVNQYLKGVYSTVLLKDVFARNSVRDTALMEKIILYLMDNVGNLFSALNVASFLKNQGRSVGVETIYNYMRMLENAFFLVKAPRFDIKGRKWLETNEKCYLADLGLRHAIIGYRDMDIGGLLENVVHQELLVRGYTVGIGKTGTKEIDFIATKGDETSYYQVCYLLAGAETIEREFSVLKAIPDNYPKTVLSMDRLLAPQRDGIRWKNLTDFLLEPHE